jgi:alpha-N-arabinofuranosidase
VRSVRAARQLSDRNPSSVNTAAEPDRVRPGLLGGAQLSAHVLRATLAPASWNMIRLGSAL